MAKNKKRPTGGAAAFRNNQRMMQFVAREQTGEIINKAYRRGESSGYARTTIVTLWILHEKYGFGLKRMMDFLHELADFCNDHLDNRNKSRKGYHGVNVVEMRDALFEELGIWINLTGGRVWIQDKPYNKEQLPKEALLEGVPYFEHEDALTKQND